MAFNGNGSYSAPANSWNPAVDGTDISSSDWAALLADLSTALSTCVTKDGQTTTTAIVPFSAGIETDILSPITASGPVSLTAGQLKFPATENASADVNTLDDYEEGTFTPAFAFGGGTAGMTFTTRAGRYVKVGQLVTVWVQVQFSDKGSDVGNMTLTAMPFTSVNASTPLAAASVVGNSLAASAAGQLIGLMQSNSTTMNIYQFAAGSITQLTNADFANTSSIWATFSYQAAA